MEISLTKASAFAPKSLASSPAPNGSAFSEALAAAGSAPNPAAGKADIVSGRLGVQLERGRPYAVVYFDATGQKLTQTPFNAPALLEKAAQFGIPLSDLNGLADQMDAKGVAYKPYQLFQGTGSDGGIDLRDLATGGLGTAFDWRVDPNVSQKAKSGADTLLANQILAQQLGVTPSNVTRQAAAAASVDSASTNASAVVSPAPAWTVTNPQADITSGRLGILLDKGVRPYAMVYFDDAGQKLTQTTFEPATILRKATEFGIPLSDLHGLADQMDAKGVAYKPYQLFQGTGSDGGIDLRDLATGGLGTAFDWRVDPNVSQKAKSGADTLLANQILAQQLGVTPSNVTNMLRPPRRSIRLPPTPALSWPAPAQLQ